MAETHRLGQSLGWFAKLCRDTNERNNIFNWIVATKQDRSPREGYGT